MIRALFGRRENRRPQHWGRSSVGRASRSQCEGQGFDPPRLHHPPLPDVPKTSKKHLRINGFPRKRFLNAPAHAHIVPTLMWAWMWG